MLLKAFLPYWENCIVLLQKWAELCHFSVAKGKGKGRWAAAKGKTSAQLPLWTELLSHRPVMGAAAWIQNFSIGDGVSAASALLKVFVWKLDSTRGRIYELVSLIFVFVWKGSVLVLGHCKVAPSFFLFVFFLYKEPIFLLGYWNSTGWKACEEECSSSLQVSLESYNSPTCEKMPFPWWASAAAHRVVGVSIWLVKAQRIKWSVQMEAEIASSEISSCSKEGIEQGSLPYSSEKNCPGYKVRQEILAVLRRKGCRARLNFRACRVWFSQELDFPQSVTRTQKLESVKTLRTLNKDTQFIILLVLGKYNTQKSGLTASTPLGSGRSDTELELVSPAHTVFCLISVDCFSIICCILGSRHWFCYAERETVCIYYRQA